MLQARAPHAARTRSVWIALSIVYVVWGSTYLAIRVAVRTMPPFLMAGSRFVLAGLILYGWDRWSAARTGSPEMREVERPAGAGSPSRWGWLRPWGGALLIGGLLLLGGNGGVVWGESHHVTSGVSALIFATLPMWMALLTFLLYRERLSPTVIGGLVLGFGGIALLVGGVSGGRSGVVGPLVVLSGAFCWSLGAVLTRWAPLPARQARSTALQMICGGALLVLAGLVAGELSRLHWDRISTGSWLAWLYLLFVGSLVGFTAFAWLLSHARISLVSTYAYVNPIVALFLGWAILGETMTPRMFVASAVVIAAVAIIVSARSVVRTPDVDERAELTSAEHP
jgi:drug/metabolite transporter (DMT)-like permease